MRKVMNLVTFVAVAAMAAIATAQPASFTDLGDIGPSGSFTFDTTGSQFPAAGTSGPVNVDTELGLFDAAGNVLAADDDGGTGLFSSITETLAAGTYFLAISEFNSEFEDGFVNSGTGFEAGESADLVLNINGIFAGTSLAGDGAGLEETAFFRVTVNAIPEPTTGALLAVAGLGFLRRRRA